MIALRGSVIAIAVRKTIQNVARSFECAGVGDEFAARLSRYRD
jgi:hypothetical protein